MDREKVSSSNVVAIGYDAVSQTLEVEFKDSIYQYFDVPASIHDGLMRANSLGESVGSYLDQYVKKAGFLYQRQ